MDFLFRFPWTQSGDDGIWTIVDRLTKTARFLPIKVIYSINKLAKIYVDEIIICRKLWVLNFISVQLFIHKQMFKGNWDTHIPLMKFAYNNSYHSSIEMALLKHYMVGNAKLQYVGMKRRRNLEFDVGDRVFLQLSPWKGVIRFELSIIHDVFHVSMLHKYILDPSHVLESKPVELKENLTYEEELVQILDKKE
ncbi:uncharacterized protein LOC111394891 [Olea europaea var. sylvestris]|uniref:uncharacterized protein LOC111394891 n=1 Tax=Olea europaea var. sylvestris TaxID=158386 RepID=UPI000C1D2469|nr:uncharacterized protein LOC111394891 [Olea europaea var. sylvestris]